MPGSGEGTANAQADAKIREVRGVEPVKTQAQIEIDRNRALTDFNVWKEKQPIELRNKLSFEDFVQDRQDTRNAYNQGEETTRTVIREDRQDARGSGKTDTPGARDARAKSMFEDGLKQWEAAGRPQGSRPQLKDYYSASGGTCRRRRRRWSKQPHDRFDWQDLYQGPVRRGGRGCRN
jgi:hypothetical protein